MTALCINMSLDSIWISIWLLKVGAIAIILRFLIRENQIKSGKNQGIWLLKMCGHPVWILFGCNKYHIWSYLVCNRRQFQIHPPPPPPPPPPSQFTWNVKTCFLWKKKKKILSSAALMTGALRVNLTPCWRKLQWFVKMVVYQLIKVSASI